MKHEDDFPNWEIKVEHRSSPPLRWIANLFGTIGGWAVLRISYYNDDNNFGIGYKACSVIFDMTWPIYEKYGTFYQVFFDEEDNA